MANNRTLKYTIRVGLDESSVKEAKSKIDSYINNAKSGGAMSKELEKSVKEAEQLSRIIESSWSNKLNNIDVHKLNDSLRQAYGNMDNIRRVAEKVDKETFGSLASAIMDANTQMTQSSKVLNKIAQSFGRTLGWGLTSSVVNSFSRAIQGAWGYVQHLDKSLNNIRIVSGESAANMEKFAKQANAAAKSLGASTLDYTDAALIYYQQGLDEKQVSERTETTLKMANAIGVDAATVSSYMTGIWNNFDDGTKTLEYFGDALVALGASTAASSSEIAEGLTKFSAIADTVGLSYEYATSALATVVSATRQSAEVVGTAFKTIFARMEDLKLGETIEDGTDIGKYAQGLAAVGISIKDSSGQLKDMDTLLDEMGAKWQTLSKDQQVALAQTVAGIRQYSQLVALMDNWDSMKENIQTAANATGTLQKQQETYMESMQAHFQGLTTEWQRTYDIIFNPDTMNETVDVVTSLLEKFNDFIEGIGGGSKAIVYFASVFTNIFSRQIGESLQRIINNIKIIQSNRNLIKSHKDLVNTPNSELVEAVKTSNIKRNATIAEGNNKIFEKEINDYKEILKFSHLLTKEQQEQLKDSIAQEASLRAQVEERKKNINAAKNKKDEIQNNNNIDFDSYINAHYSGEVSEIEDISNLYNNLKEYKKFMEGKSNISSLDNLFDDTFLEELNKLDEGGLDALVSYVEQQKIILQDNTEELNSQADAEERIRREQIDNIQQAQKYQKVIQGISLVTQGIAVAAGAIQQYVESTNDGLSKQEKHLMRVQSGFSAASGLANTISMGVGAAIGNPMLGMVIGTAISSGLSLIGSFATKSAKKEVERVKKAAEQAAKDLEESRKKIEEQQSLQDTYSKSDTAQEWKVLIAGVDEYGNNISLTNEEYNKYLQYCKEMAEIDDSLIDGYNREGQAIIVSKNAIEQMNEALKEQIRLNEKASLTGEHYDARLQEIKDAQKAGKDELKVITDKYKKINNKNLQNSFNEASEQFSDKEGYGIFLAFKNNGYSDLVKQYKTHYGKNPFFDPKATKEQQLEILDQWKNALTEIANTNEDYNFNSFLDQIDKAKEAIEKYSDDVDIAKENVKQLSAVQNLAFEKAIYVDEESSAVYEHLSNRAASLVKDFSSSLDFSDQDYNNREEAIQKHQEAIEKYIQFLGTADEETLQLIEDIKNLNFDSETAYETTFSNLRKKGLSVDLFEALGFIKTEGLNDADATLTVTKNLEELQKKIEEAYDEKGVNTDFISELKPSELKEFNSYLEKIDYNITDSTYKFFEQSQATKDFASSLNLLNTELEVAGKALSEFTKDGKISEGTLKSLEAQYKELAEMTDKTSHKYIARVRELREKTEQDKLDSLREEKTRLNEAAKDYEKTLDELFEQKESWEILDKDKAKEIEVQIKANLEQYEKTMDQILSANYETYITVNADLKTDVENALGLSKEFNALKEYVAEDLTVALDDVQKIIDAGYGGMLINAKKTTEGRILLDKEAMNTYIDNRQTELEADKQSKIAQLKNQRELLVAQRNILETKMQHIKKALEASSETERQAALSEIEADDIAYKNQRRLLENELKDKEAYATDNLSIQKDVFAELGGMYKTDGENQVAVADAIQKNNNANAKQEYENKKALRNILLDINRIQWDTSKGKKFDTSTLLAGDDLKEGEEKLKEDFEKLIQNFAEPIVSKMGKLVNNVFSNSTEEAKEEMGLLTVSMENTLRTLEKQTQEQIDLLDNQIGEIDGSIAAMGSTSEQLDTLQKFAQEDIKEGIELLEVEIDKYHDINLALKDIENQLKRVQAAQKNLFGEDLKNNLNEQLDLLATQKDLNNQKMKIAEADAKERRAKLSAQGVTFDENGLISNYWAALQGKMNYVNELTKQYNSMPEVQQKSFKDTLEKAKKDYEKFQKQISEYDTLISETIPGIEDAIQDAFNKEIEIKISKFNTSIDIRLNMKKAEQDFNTFKDKVIDQLKDDDILGRANSELRNYSLYYNQANTGAIQATTAQVKNLLQELNKMDSTGSSSIYGNNRKQLLDDLAKYKNELTTLLTEEQTLVESIKKEYLSMIDEATNKFKEHISQYQYIEELLKHDINLIGLLYGDKAYAEMDTYYKKIEENNNKNLAFLRDTASYYKEMMDAATDNDSRKKWEAAWEESLKNLNSATESAIKNLQDKYKNGIKEIFKEWEESLTNGSDLSWVEESWERVKAQSEAYLDDINREFEIRNFQRNAKEALNNNTSLKAQSQITKVMNEQLEILKEKENLSKYDVERANKMLDITLKQIALEDARNNKSQMRLRRDSQGNYSYQFVADADEVAKAEEELEKAKNELYNFDKSELTKSQDEAIKMLKEFEEKIIALYENSNLSPEVRAKRELELKKYYGERINALVGDNEQIRINLIGSATMSIEDFLDSELQTFLNMNDQEKNSFLGDLVPAINSGVQDMINIFAGSGGFEEVCSNAFTNLKERSEEYKNSLNELEQSAGKNFAEIKNGIDRTTDSVQELIPENDKLLKQYRDQISAVQNVVSQLDQMTTSYNDNRDAAIKAAEAAQDYYIKAQEAAAQVKQLYDGVSRAKDAYTSFGAVYQAVMTGAGSGNSSANANSNNNSETANSTREEKTRRVLYARDVKPGPDSSAMGYNLDYLDAYTTVKVVKEVKGSNYPYYVEYEDKKGNKRSGWIKGYIDGFASGGYTGDWNSNNGRLAMLHEKELVLNKEDTHNLLEMVNIARASYKSILMQNLSSRITSLLGGLNSHNLQYNTIPSPSSSSLDQNVNIEANFPAVRDAVEIKEALNNLINVASQRANYQPW